MLARCFDRLIIYCVHCGLLITGSLVTPAYTFVCDVKTFMRRRHCILNALPRQLQASQLPSHQFTTAASSLLLLPLLSSIYHLSKFFSFVLALVKSSEATSNKNRFSGSSSQLQCSISGESFSGDVFIVTDFLLKIITASYITLHNN